ncbi:hypothetical protein INR49_013622 [Caranx melampygus]|nr:hypothetical protein INR49_013622 [Caranx melampygus]
MDCIITTALILSVFKAALCFNIDPHPWKSWSNGASGFGYQVVQRQSDLLVSAPLEQYSPNERGEIYKCSSNVNRCQKLFPSVPDFAVNMSLGLTMTHDPVGQDTLACGPTIPKECSGITMYNGVCFRIYSASSSSSAAIPSSIEDCQDADIAFLLDGSGSVSGTDFQKMREFVKSLVRSFLGRSKKGKNVQFAIAQFSSSPKVHYFFNTFSSTNWESQIDRIRQQGGATYTANAIDHVVKNIFTPEKGSRPNAKRNLIVITDGESHDRPNLDAAIALADQKKIVRFAIGVGNAFSTYSAKNELETIASKPTSDHMFQVENFQALEKIKQTLQDKIFSIEGSQSGGDTLEMEMAQRGFSAALGPQGIQMGIVGANQWRGGYILYSNTGQTSYQPMFIEPDSYLGYSMAVAKTRQGTLTVVGAPRHNHIGIVMAVDSRQNSQIIDPSRWQFQTGEYFGAEVCAMDLDFDTYTDLILISAPMYKEADREGRVYICTLISSKVECRLDSPLILRGAAAEKGRFGSSLAALHDLNKDSLRDLVVGAPLENDGQGSIYMFLGERGGIVGTYSQRIAASEVQQGLKFFGISISQQSFDHSQDRLPDLAVGSKGTVVLLRSQPVVMVEAKMSFNPNIIPSQNQDCTTPLKFMATICFTMTRHPQGEKVKANITYTLTLDATRKAPNNRAYITKDQQEMNGRIDIVSNVQNCPIVNFFVDACPEDALNELSNELKFTFEGQPSNTNLKPSLAPQAQTTTIHPLGFEINCGSDDKCVDNLKMDFNFTSSSEIKVGIDELLNVTVSVENRGENSYNSRVILTYPAGLSYRKFTGLLGRIECNSLDSEDGASRGKTVCTVDKPIFKSNSKALFTISYGIETNSNLQNSIYITANATSGNQDHAISSELYKRRDIDVKYSIFVTVESSLIYTNFSFGKNNLKKPVQQSILVTNDIRALNFTVVVRVPVQLGTKNIWEDSNSLQIPGCERHAHEEASVTKFVAEIQKTKVVNCSVARCAVFRCTSFMGRLESKRYQISANLSSRWIEQIGLESAKFRLISTASLDYNRNKYIFVSAASNNNPPIHKIETEVETYSEPDFTTAIIGGSLGGLAVLALLSAGLYKAGFFKSKYKNMIEEGGEGADQGGDGAGATPGQA